MPALSYKVTPGLTLDLAYRYTDLGDAVSGTRTAYDFSGTAKGIEINDITSQRRHAFSALGARLAASADAGRFQIKSPSTIRLLADLPPVTSTGGFFCARR